MIDDRAKEIHRLQAVALQLQSCRSPQEKLAVLVRESKGGATPSFLSDEERVILTSLTIIGQEKVLEGVEDIRAVVSSLIEVENFYASLGGIVGYHLQMLCLLEQQKQRKIEEGCSYEPPRGIDISQQSPVIDAYVEKGLERLPFLAEVYTVGGAADRLRPCDPVTLDPLPAASLSFCGASFLEWLVRDLEAREALYHRRFGRWLTTPIALMTSREKNNHEHIHSLCEEKKWFGRGRENVRLFCQPLVPTMNAEGQWCLVGRGKLLMKPGGHGVLWKLAQEQGIFQWFKGLGRQKLLVRQINNPIAGIDRGLLAFCGVGFTHNKSFGFASCLRQVHTAEGVNVVIKKRGSYCLTNVEYCDFEKYAIKDEPLTEGNLYSQYPSNTNILFADIDAIQDKLKEMPIPGMLVNQKSVVVQDEEGNMSEKSIVRLESTMQNLADAFVSAKEDELPTFLTYHARHKTISAVKKMGQVGMSPLETPEGCLYDLIKNAHELLSSYCKMDVPSLQDPLSTPSFFFFYHPALGPLFSDIAQKIRKGKVVQGAEVRLEIANLEMENVEIEGAVLIEADPVLAREDKEQLGRCVLKNVRIVNAGIDPLALSGYWKLEKGSDVYQERCVIRLSKNSCLYAEGITLTGNQIIEVKEGETMHLVSPKH